MECECESQTSALQRICSRKNTFLRRKYNDTTQVLIKNDEQSGDDLAKPGKEIFRKMYLGEEALTVENSILREI